MDLTSSFVTCYTTRASSQTCVLPVKAEYNWKLRSFRNTDEHVNSDVAYVHLLHFFFTASTPLHFAPQTCLAIRTRYISSPHILATPNHVRLNASCLIHHCRNTSLFIQAPPCADASLRQYGRYQSRQRLHSSGAHRPIRTLRLQPPNKAQFRRPAQASNPRFSTTPR